MGTSASIRFWMHAALHPSFGVRGPVKNGRGRQRYFQQLSCGLRPHDGEQPQDGASQRADNVLPPSCDIQLPSEFRDERYRSCQLHSFTNTLYLSHIDAPRAGYNAS